MRLTQACRFFRLLQILVDQRHDGVTRVPPDALWLMASVQAFSARHCTMMCNASMQFLLPPECFRAARGVGLWGRLRHFEVDGYLDQSPNDLRRHDREDAE